MRPALGDLVDVVAFHVVFNQEFPGAFGGDQRKTPLCKLARDRQQMRLVGVANRKKDAPAGRSLYAHGLLSASDRGAEGLSDAHDLAGGAHLGPQDGIDAGELDERKCRLLDRIETGLKILRNPLFFKRFTDHAIRGNLGQRHACRLGHERYRARCPRIDLEDKNLFASDRELDVHKADNVEAKRHLAGLVGDLVDNRFESENGGSEQLESPECTPACSMCSMMPPMTTILPSLTASTSTSIAWSRKRSSRTGESFETLTASRM